MQKIQGQTRAVVRDIWPIVENGRYPIKRVVGDQIHVWFDTFADGHDVVRGGLRFKHESERKWTYKSANDIGNDRWHAIFEVSKQGYYTYEPLGWIDYALTWQHGITKKIDAGQSVVVELQEGLPFLKAILKLAGKEEKRYLADCIEAFEDAGLYEKAIALARSESLHRIFTTYPNQP